MQIAEHTIVRFHYDLADEAGQPIESSREREPMAILYGAGNVIPGIEKAIEGRRAGERLQVTVPPAEGYGERREGLTQRVPKKFFNEARKLRPGDSTVLGSNQGPRVVTVLKIGETVIDVDLNHPMAGRTLCFDIEIIEVREASAEEIAHGHAHEPGGHAHG
ncbi:MAG TPA: peptidylprolyl isomerase [Pseudomonadota bacterium]|nr:peptidylprolyl isomerase [Xanthomonadales bacterium]HQY36204.1 peptidylprolyl isomerase [Pseudomonadota bacterium]HRA37014.1 peptidylprolyl isomerase [Pseudomonadota bacterium]